MPIGYFGNTVMQHRPGIAFATGAGDSITSINTKLSSVYTSANLSYWLGQGNGLYGNAFVRRNWSALFTNQAVKPTDMADPDDPAYNWDPIEDLLDMAVWQTMGARNLIVHLFWTNGRWPSWFGNTSGYTYISGNGTPQVNWGNAAARQDMKDYLTALYLKFGIDSFWALGFSESLGGGLPSGVTQQQMNDGMNEVYNFGSIQFGGRVQLYQKYGSPALRAGALPEIGDFYPDPRPFQGGCISPTGCDPSGGYGVMQSRIIANQALVMHGLENNGLTLGQYPDGFPNPWNYDSSTPPHYLTAREYAHYYGVNGIMPVHITVWNPEEWGNPGKGSAEVQLAKIIDALNWSMSGGGQFLPALSPTYGDAVPTVTTEALTFIAAGTVSTSGSPGDPAGKQAGDILLYIAGARAAGESPNAPANYPDRIDSAGDASLAVYGRIATGDSNDSISGHDAFSGTSANRQVILCFRPSSTIALSALKVAEIVTSNVNNADAPTGAVAVPSDKCTILSIIRKAKTATSNGATLTRPSGIDNTAASSVGTGSSIIFAVGYTTQTTAADIAAGTWDQSIDEVGATSSITLVLGPSASEDVTELDAVSDFALGSATSDSLKATFSDVTDAEYYRLYLSADGGTTYPFYVEITQAEKTSGTGYTFTGLSGATTYQGYVVARTGTVLSDASNIDSEATTTPADATAPTHGGITAVSLVEDQVLVEHTQGTDGVTSQGNIRYFLFFGVGTVDYDSYVAGPLAAQDSYYVPRDMFVGPEGGTIVLDLLAMDEAGLLSAHDATPPSLVIPEQSYGLIRPCQLNTGTIQSGTVWLSYAPKNSTTTINWSDPENSAASEVTFDENGQIKVYCDAGEYDFVLQNDDGSWRASGEFTSE